MRLSNLIAVSALLVSTGCTSIGQRTNVSVDYYDVKGTSFAQVDKQIALHGPIVEGVGKAIASTSVRMIPDVVFAQRGKLCSVVRANIRVQADVTLPRLSDRRKARKDLQGAFSNIERYARLHEAVHVSIADKHAELAEAAIRRLPPRASCPQLRSDAVAAFEKVMVSHRKAQRDFDSDEQKRFARASAS